MPRSRFCARAATCVLLVVQGGKPQASGPTAHSHPVGTVMYLQGDGIPEIRCAPRNGCKIILHAGELLKTEPYLEHPWLWKTSTTQLGDGYGAEPVIHLQPAANGVRSHLLILTDRRAYGFTLLSTSTGAVGTLMFAISDDSEENNDDRDGLWQEIENAGRTRE
jgi:hypothetical protein